MTTRKELYSSPILADWNYLIFLIMAIILINFNRLSPAISGQDFSRF